MCVCVCVWEREQNDVQSFMKTLKMEQVPVQIPSQTTLVNTQCIFLFIYLIYLFLTTVHVHCYIRSFPSRCELRLLSPCGLPASHHGGFSCCRAQVLEHTGSIVVVRGLSCPLQMGSSWTRGWNYVSCTGRQIPNHLEPNDHHRTSDLRSIREVHNVRLFKESFP